MGMTELMYRYAAEDDLTLSEAKERLHDNAYIRTASETLAKYCGVPEDDLKSLRRKVSDLLTDSDPSQKKESNDKKVRTWINKKLQFISRESAMQLAFALHLPVKDAEEMLWRLCGEGFHWRDPKDIVWLYALEHGMEYREALDLFLRMPSSDERSEDGREDKETMTESIKEEVRQLQSEEELLAFLKERAPYLGSLHNTAYSLFMDFMDLLRSAPTADSLPEARNMPANEIVSTYLYNQLIPRDKKAKGSKKTEEAVRDAIQRDIQQNWPDEFALSRMTNREIDVSRKVLILLFLATDGGDSKYGGDYLDSPEDIFEDTYARLSSMLNDCGFPPLDPRIPFDWMVLYCMVAEDLSDIDENIPRFLEEIFRTPSEEAEDDTRE